ncbi:hypothetical protein LCGC14_0458920 [marine sediment metagenome]|uniref:Uncharacterized protein n=1 Tax=marine sediment metagenome TaxID=412755 RepID=A0A0F9SL21_9ZZZZ
MANQRVLYTEEMVGDGHPTKSDTLNRQTNVEHNNDGTHNEINASGVTISALTASKPVFTDGGKNLVSTGTHPVDQGGTGQTTLPALNATLYDVVQASDVGIATNDTMALVFDFVPSKIVIDYSSVQRHDTTSEKGLSTGHCVVIITGTDTKTNNLNANHVYDSNGSFHSTSTSGEVTNLTQGSGGDDGVDTASVSATGAWVTATKTLTLTFTSTNASDADTHLEVLATAYV